MPFELIPPHRRKIAVIGAGVSGLGAAHFLADEHDVTLFEAEPRLGGHARTIIAGKNGDQPVDTGFIVFNYANYPELSALFDRLNVPVVKSNMSFGASINGGRLEYGLENAGAFFAQKRNAMSPRFLGMLRDIFRFNARALSAAGNRDQTIAELLERLGTGKWFRDFYLLPLTGAIWSTPKQKIMEFPAHAMLQFMENHALLNYSGQHQWYTVAGGSVSYVTRLERALAAQGVRLRPGTPIQAVQRGPSGASVKASGAAWEDYDEVVFATHSDDTLRLLADADAQERADLGAIAYQPNDIVLHADQTIMPRRRAVWSSWNYTEGQGRREGQIDLTYWMNRLQPIPQDDPHFVTLNSNRPIREELIYDQVTLRHPVYDTAALAAQGRIAARNGTRSTWFCGAWMGHGFHEDGLSSALQVARTMTGARLPAAA